MGLFTRRDCVKRSASSDSGEMTAGSTGGSTTGGGRNLNRRMSIIQEMQSQLPRLSLFEIHVNNSSKIPSGSNRPITKPKPFRAGNSISLWIECFEDYCTARNLQPRNKVLELTNQLDTYSLKILSEYGRLKYHKEMNYTEYYGANYNQLYQDLLSCLDEQLINQTRHSDTALYQ